MPIVAFANRIHVIHDKSIHVSPAILSLVQLDDPVTGVPNAADTPPGFER